MWQHTWHTGDPGNGKVALTWSLGYWILKNPTVENLPPNMSTAVELGRPGPRTPRKESGLTLLSGASGRMNKSLLSSCFVLFTLQFPRVGLGKGLRQLLLLSGAVSFMSFTKTLFWSSMEMRDNSHNLHHFHLQPHYLVFTYLNAHYFLTLIPSLRTWCPITAQLCLLSFCPFSETCRFCRGGQLKVGFRQDLTGERLRDFSCFLCFNLVSDLGGEKKAAHVGN